VAVSALDPIDQPVEQELVILAGLSKSEEKNPYNQVELFAQLPSGQGKNKHRHYTTTQFLFFSRKAPENVPRGTSRLTLAEQYFCESIELDSEHVRSEVLPSQKTGQLSGALVVKLSATLTKKGNDVPSYVTRIYFGPRDFFYLRKYGLESALPVGAFGQIGLILLLMIDWIGKRTHNYGLAIVLFGSFVTLVTAPYTLMGMRSMRKLQELQPKLERLKAQHANDQKKLMEATMALYREHRVSPFGGCLPMLLPMPIFIALFQGLRHFIALRGERFLWIADLTQPDRIARIFGIEINALPIALSVLMFFQSKLSRKGLPRSPGDSVANAMSGPLMPILFGFMFYSVPSGLVLYWLTNSLLSLLWYRFAK
jgi:YidC/Oxa1 family membrane protein insertase